MRFGWSHNIKPKVKSNRQRKKTRHRVKCIPYTKICKETYILVIVSVAKAYRHSLKPYKLVAENETYETLEHERHSQMHMSDTTTPNFLSLFIKFFGCCYIFFCRLWMFTLFPWKSAFRGFEVVKWKCSFLCHQFAEIIHAIPTISSLIFMLSCT